jgi:hypothetical protein
LRRNRENNNREKSVKTLYGKWEMSKKIQQKKGAKAGNGRKKIG